MLILLVLNGYAAWAQSTRTVRLTLAPKPARIIRPDDALGFGIDGGKQATTARLLRPDTLEALRSLGLSRLTYRLRTELGVEAWHWNPAGTWSDPAQQQGYWTSLESATPIHCSWGYCLPRRGTTADQANNNGYSRLTDGSVQTFWKSNPYLDSRFTGEPDAAHPQWVVVDFGKPQPVNAIRLRWAMPYATQYRVEFCRFDPETPVQGLDDTFQATAHWQAFPGGRVQQGHGGDVTLLLDRKPRLVRFVRVWMTQSSHTAPPESRDPRDGCGYALCELEIGIVRKDGGLEDRVHHAPDTHLQTRTYASSSDPWHRASDRDPNTEQPGLDALVGAKLCSSRPILLPVGVVYDTPENAAAFLRYLRRRQIPVRQMELGEEPDGQYISPEDYGALFLQFARALRAVDGRIELGGPSLQSSQEGWLYWPNQTGDCSWMRRFLRYLRQHNALSLFAFFSFEWYPFDDMQPGPEAQLQANPGLLDRLLASLETKGVPHTIPWLITELGWSSYATCNEVELPGALLDAESAARFLLRRDGATFFYGVTPGPLSYDPGVPGASWGGLQAFLSDKTGRVQATLPVAWAVRLLTRVWLQSDALDQPHALYAVSTTDATVGAYAVHRPDGAWALLLLNRNEHRALSVRLPYSGKAMAWRYGPAQYHWHADGAQGRPSCNLPPAQLTCHETLVLPPFSLTVVRWRYPE